MKQTILVAALIATNCFAQTKITIPESSFTICRSQRDNECNPKTDYWAGCDDQTARINGIIATECTVKSLDGSDFVRKYTERQLSSKWRSECGVTAIRITCVATTIEK